MIALGNRSVEMDVAARERKLRSHDDPGGAIRRFSRFGMGGIVESTVVRNATGAARASVIVLSSRSIRTGTTTARASPTPRMTRSGTTGEGGGGVMRAVAR